MIESAKKHFRIYRKFFRAFVKIKLIYKTDFVLGLTNQFISIATSLGLIGLIFTQIQSLNGWSFYELVFLFGIGRFVLNFHTFFFFSLVFLGEKYIINGRLDRYFVRPLNVLFQVYGSYLNLHNFGDAVASLIIVSYAAYQLPIHFLTPVKLIYAFLGLTSAVIVIAAIFLAISTIGFWTGRTGSLFSLIWNIREFQKYPYGIYPQALKIFLVTLMPLMFASFFPASFLLERYEYLEFQIFVLVAGPLFYLIAYRFWSFGLERYSSTGS